jgi:hypothetical protein
MFTPTNSRQNPMQPPVWGNALVNPDGSALNFGLPYNRLETPRSAYPNPVNPQLTGFINTLLGQMPVIGNVVYPVNVSLMTGSALIKPMVVAKSRSGG